MSSITEHITSLLLTLYYCLESLVLRFIPKRLRFKDVSNETVLITGGGSGLGRLFALSFAQLGARIVLWDINEKGNQETANLIADIGGSAHCYLCDVSDRKKVYEVAAKVKDEVGKVSILINNAGIVTGKQFLDCSDEKIEATFKVNAISHFWMLKAFLPDMLESNHGHIVTIASLAGLCGTVGLSDYCASKFAVVGLEESLRFEILRKGYTGVHSTVVCPYFVGTGMFEGTSPGDFYLLKPDEVVKEAMEAILVNQEVVVIPKFFNVLLALKSMLPASANFEALNMFGVTNCMDTFKGRKMINASVKE